MEKEYSEIIVSHQRLSEINPKYDRPFFEDLRNAQTAVCMRSW